MWRQFCLTITSANVDWFQYLYNHKLCLTGINTTTQHLNYNGHELSLSDHSLLWKHSLRVARVFHSRLWSNYNVYVDISPFSVFAFLDCRETAIVVCGKHVAERGDIKQRPFCHSKRRASCMRRVESSCGISLARFPLERTCRTARLTGRL